MRKKKEIVRDHQRLEPVFAFRLIKAVRPSESVIRTKVAQLYIKQTMKCKFGGVKEIWMDLNFYVEIGSTDGKKSCRLSEK